MEKTQNANEHLLQARMKQSNSMKAGGMVKYGEVDWKEGFNKARIKRLNKFMLSLSSGEKLRPRRLQCSCLTCH